ncbi:DUF4435 domain-containing protein [Vibrio rotiferianus]|uniref:DUF4435 domain-containing protein n=1 Tax=Vibrio rotiferianus TaxID=190895 RepID=UPI0011107CE3|nr:DUF4435 domain-containing protein [Vibrio rotiferianus]TMX55914.1 hypothetical protein DA097_24430 [Vibrio rotiferianus]
MIPSYKQKHMSSIGVLYRQLQDIEIYVEDQDSEVFYMQLFTRLLDGTAKIKKVIPLNGRKNVIDGASNHKDDSPKVYVIDGDLYRNANLFNNELARLYVHNFYCVENALFCVNAAAKIVQESLGNVTIIEAKERLNWDDWLEEITPHLVRLFTLFSAAFKLNPTIKTTSRGFTSIITSCKNKLPYLDSDKVEAQYNEVLDALREDFSDKEIEEEIESVMAFAEDNGLDIVSGKDFLIPLMCFKIKEACGVSLTVNSRNFRLASHCDLDKLAPLKEFIKDEIARHKNIAA